MLKRYDKTKLVHLKRRGKLYEAGTLNSRAK